jgi:hypothetical protein
MAMFRGFDPTEPISLARLALRDGRARFVEQADALAQEAIRMAGEYPDEARAGVYAALGAQLVLGTPAAS